MDAEAPPLPDAAARPLLVYDGDCGFCVRSAMRWRWQVGEAVDFGPSQALEHPIPGVDAEDYRRSVVFHEPREGRVSRGAEAVFRVLAAGGRRWPLWLYRRVPGVAALTEWGYARVAARRQLVSLLDRWCVGRSHLASTFAASRSLFVRGLGLVVALAFLSLWVQVHGLVGSQGIVPVGELLEGVDRARGGASWTDVPTVLWWGSGDLVLHGLCAAGVALGLLVLVDLAPALCLLLAAALYLSLVHAGHVFLQFQWDSLLVESCVLGALYAPWRLGRSRGRDPEPSRVGRLLVWWLLFRFMFESGVVKLTWGDPTWADLSAMTYHYMTQPLPHLASRFAHHLPRVVHEASALAMFGIEIGLPLLVLAPRRLRHLAAAGMLALQVLIAATGNYGFFNLLSALLCLSLLDDQVLSALAACRPWRRSPQEPATSAAARHDTLEAPAVAGGGEEPVCEVPLTLFLTPPRRDSESPWRVRLVSLAAVVALVLGLLHLTDLDPERPRAPLSAEVVEGGVLGALLSSGPVAAARVLEDHLRPFLLVNPYGLFRVMTTTRPEIRVEALPRGERADDEEAWVEYAFAAKPDGRTARTPPWVQPHMPRLDWRLWFEALSWEAAHERGQPYQARARTLASPWFQRFLVRLLEAEPTVLALLDGDPLDGAPPAAVRARLFDYRFTTGAEAAASGEVWVATPLDLAGVTFSNPP